MNVNELEVYSNDDTETTIHFDDSCGEVIIDDGNEDSEDDNMCYMCFLCDRQFNSLEDLYKHNASKDHLKKIKENCQRKPTISMEEDMLHMKYKEEEQWIRDNLCEEKGFGFSCDSCRAKDLSPSNLEKTLKELNVLSDEVVQFWNEDDDNFECESDDSVMKNIRRRIYNPLQTWGTDCGIASDDEDLNKNQEFESGHSRMAFDTKGRRVNIVELDPVEKVDQVVKDDDETIFKLPGGWCVFEKKTETGITLRVVLVKTLQQIGQEEKCCK